MRHAGRKLLLAIVGSTMMAKAQLHSTPSPPSFEVASIKLNRSGERIMLFQPARGGRFTATNCSLSLLIQYAYDVMQFQISGAPDWVKSERYDIATKAEGDPQVDELRAMLQRLLEDRFQLQHHWDTREATVYDLVVSKPGRLKESEPGDCPSILSPSGSQPGAPPDDAPCGALRNSPGRTKGYKLTAADLAGSLSFFLGRLVRDKTALTGKYDIDLRWTPESLQMQSPAPAEPAGPSIFTAIQEQLGLKLKSAQGPVKTLVVDRVEKPSGN